MTDNKDHANLIRSGALAVPADTAETNAMTPEELKSVLQSGLLSFPLTDFDADLRFAPGPYAERLEWLQPYGASVLFAAGGTGEFFSLEPREFSDVVRVALDTCREIGRAHV